MEGEEACSCGVARLRIAGQEAYSNMLRAEPTADSCRQLYIGNGRRGDDARSKLENLTGFFSSLAGCALADAELIVVLKVRRGGPDQGGPGGDWRVEKARKRKRKRVESGQIREDEQARER